MSTWIVISWVGVATLTGINVFVFLKLKQASEQMLKMAFPGAQNMNEAVSQMQKMMQGMGGMAGGRGGRGANPFGGMAGGPGGAKSPDAQLKAAMEMLERSSRKKL